MAKILLAKARHVEFHQGVLVPPLGIMYIASVLREAGHHVRIFDCGPDWNRTDRFEEALLDFRPQVVGISGITVEGRTMEGMAALARATLPEVHIIVGGPHASAYPVHCASHPAIDYVAIGEGEQTALELVNALTRGGRDPRTVPGVAWQDESGNVTFAAGRAAIEDVDAIPFPAWDLIDVGLYARVGTMANMGHRPCMALFTSRGCPFKCVYCHEVQGKRFRARSPENVLREMEELRQRYGIRDFEVVDDIFNFDRDRMLEILERVIASDLHPQLHFPNALRTDLLDETQIVKLKQAGTSSLSVAVETVTERLQKLTKKHLNVGKVIENIEIAARQKMWVRGFFMLGFPTETLAEGRATVECALKTSLHEAAFFIVTPYAGTALYEVYQELLRQRGVDLPDFQQLEPFKGNTNLSLMSDKDLFSLQQEAFRRFYLDPRRMARALVRHPRPASLLSYGIRATLMALPFKRAQHSNPIQSTWASVGLQDPHADHTRREPVRRLVAQRRNGPARLSVADSSVQAMSDPVRSVG